MATGFRFNRLLHRSESLDNVGAFNLMDKTYMRWVDTVSVKWTPELIYPA